jgi:hypothetical protein
VTDHDEFTRDPTGAGDQVFDAPLADMIKRIDEMVDRRLDDAELDRRLADVWARARAAREGWRSDFAWIAAVAVTIAVAAAVTGPRRGRRKRRRRRR